VEDFDALLGGGNFLRADFASDGRFIRWQKENSRVTW
jgi:hypothetical protein